MNNIGVFTSGGDAPGMNAALRAVVRTAIYYGKGVFTIKCGYDGMIDGEIAQVNSRAVSNIIQTGGTVIKTARSDRFRTDHGRKQAFENLKKFGIDGLIAIGGDGTFRGCMDFYNQYKLQIIGVPATIDNDLYGTDFTIGYDTAVNTALDAIDKIRDTAQSHKRFFIIEVMGRDAGFIGLETGIAGGAENILIPEIRTDVNKLCGQIKSLFDRGKTSNIVVVAEGDDAGGAHEIGAKIKQKTGIDYRAVILGHIQRGGNPSAKDRLLASKLGYWSVKHLIEGKANVMVGEINAKIVLTDLGDSVGKKKSIDADALEMAMVLASS
ncbi:6-phosphofructokinase [Planctomycetota bacterium]